MALKKIWRIRKADKEKVEYLAKELGISTILAQLLINRGYQERETIHYFLNADLEQLAAPTEIPGVSQAVKRIRKALKDKEKILVYGDYDVDGITSTALLTGVLKDVGADVSFYIPDRIDEGYGLNTPALKKMAELGMDLVVTVDCGISAYQEVEEGKGFGLDFIITDHHLPPEKLPSCTIINPILSSEDKLWKALAGVGVTFKLAQGLLEEIYGPIVGKAKGLEYLDLVALGTIADIVPLKGENRILVKYGLREMAQGKRLGMQALAEASKIDLKNITTSQVGFGLAPRLNACGRIGDPSLGVELLLTQDNQGAQEIAAQLNTENQNRQNIEAQITKEAILRVENMDLATTKVIVLAASDWHPGVIGIVASKIVEKYYRPTILLSITNGIAKGSGRSIAGFHLYQGLQQCQELLESYGGHSQAAGLSLKETNLDAFAEKINAIANQILTEDQLIPSLLLDGEINLQNTDFNLFEELVKLEPFGAANSEPILIYRRSEVKDYREVGNGGGHLKLKVKAGNSLWDGIGFNLGSHLEIAASQEPLDLAFTLDKNFWNGKTELQLILKDIKPYRQADNPYQPLSFLERIFLEGEKYIVDGWDSNLSNGSMGLDYPKDNLHLIDYRYCNDKIGYIKKLLAEGRSSLIYVNSSSAALALATELRRDMPLFKEQIAYYHNGLEPADQKAVAELFKKGSLNLVVINLLDKYLEEITTPNIVFYHLCFSLKEFRQILSRACHQNGAKVHLLYGNIEKEENNRILAARYPNREQMGQFYLLLKKIAQKSHPINWNDEQIAQWALVYKVEGLTKKQVDPWLGILEELNLIEREINGKNRTIWIIENPPKVSLEDSKLYQQGLARKSLFEEFLSLAYLKDPGNLLETLQNQKNEIIKYEE